MRKLLPDDISPIRLYCQSSLEILNCSQQGGEWRVGRFLARWGEGCKLMQDLGRPLLLGKPQQQSSAEQCNTGIWSKPLDFDGKWKKVAKSNFEEGGCKIGWDYRGRGAGVVGGHPLQTLRCKTERTVQKLQIRTFHNTMLAHPRYLSNSNAKETERLEEKSKRPDWRNPPFSTNLLYCWKFFPRELMN